jgi:hypothetical protein
MRARLLSAAALALAVAVAVAGCGSSSSGKGSSGSGGQTTGAAVNPNGPEKSPPGDIPDNQAYVAYSPPGAGFSVKVPEGWARTTHGGAVTFTDKLNSIRMEAVPAGGHVAAPPSGAKTSVVHRHAGQAARAAYLADSAPDPVTGKVRRDAIERYVFTHNGRKVILTLSGPKGADNVDPWRIVTDSLRWTA